MLIGVTDADPVCNHLLRFNAGSVKAAIIGALAYFVLPFDAIPDMLPVVGFTDDAAVLATAIRLVATHITPVHRGAARAKLARGLG